VYRAWQSAIASRQSRVDARRVLKQARVRPALLLPLQSASALCLYQGLPVPRDSSPRIRRCTHLSASLEAAGCPRVLRVRRGATIFGPLPMPPVTIGVLGAADSGGLGGTAPVVSRLPRGSPSSANRASSCSSLNRCAASASCAICA